MTDKKFIQELCTIEKDYKKRSLTDAEDAVKQQYREMFKDNFKGIKIAGGYKGVKVDDYFDFQFTKDKQLRCVIEYKYDRNLKSWKDICEILCQIIHYLHQYKEIGLDPFPNVAVIADVNECFAISTKSFIDYLNSNEIYWPKDKNASTFKSDILIKKLQNNSDVIDAFNNNVYNIKDGFKFKDFKNKIKELVTEVICPIDITEDNIVQLCEYFRNEIIEDKRDIITDGIILKLFLDVLTNEQSKYIIENNRIYYTDFLINTVDAIDIDTDLTNAKTDKENGILLSYSKFKNFTTHINRNLTDEQKNNIKRTFDILYGETIRRKLGAFFTPQLFVQYSHFMLSQYICEQWKNEYVIWDMACGTKNLTHNSIFKELYCSTLKQHELDISNDSNPEAISFQYDFLNESLENLGNKAPGLIKAFQENKKIIFYFNPPFATPSNIDTTSKGKKICETVISKEMRDKHHLGLACLQLYAQFLYRIIKIKNKFNLTNCYVAFFSVPGYITTCGYKKFREKFLNNFKLIKGCMANASIFGVSDQWGITFTIWEGIKNEEEI